jgi:hypothetical protein
MGVEQKGGWKKLHKEELQMLYYSPNIIKVIKSFLLPQDEVIAPKTQQKRCILCTQ